MPDPRRRRQILRRALIAGVADAADVDRDFDAALAVVPSRTAELLLAVVVDGRSTAEVAARFDISAARVRALVRRAMGDVAFAYRLVRAGLEPMTRRRARLAGVSLDPQTEPGGVVPESPPVYPFTLRELLESPRFAATSRLLVVVPHEPPWTPSTPADLMTVRADGRIVLGELADLRALLLVREERVDAFVHRLGPRWAMTQRRARLTPAPAPASAPGKDPRTRRAQRGGAGGRDRPPPPGGSERSNRSR